MKTLTTNRVYPACTAPMVLAVVLSGCGGGGGSSEGNGGDSGNPGTDSGSSTAVFKDNNVAGLAVTIGGQTQLTDDQGRFQFTPGDQARFSIGSVVIGDATVEKVLTLANLLPEASVNDPALINRARFLQLLDANQNPDDGITINTVLRDAASNWRITSFTNTNQFESDVATLIGDVTDAIPSATLPSAAASENHIRDTQLCVRAGAYTGDYTGGESGRFAVQVSAGDGSVIGLGIANGELTPFSLSGTEPVALDGSGDFITGSAEAGASFEGSFNNPDSLSGSWSNAALGLSGSFSGNRIGGNLNANYRFTGTFSGPDQGLFAFDVSKSGTVSGVAYSGAEDAQYQLSGSLDGTQLTASFAGGAGSINGTLDVDAGTLSGSWSNSTEGASGSFAGDGCSLNPVNNSPLEGPSGEDGTSGGDGSGSTGNALQLVGPGGISIIGPPSEQCLTYGVVTDSSLVSARAEWVSGGDTIITEDLPVLSSRTDSCPDLITAQSSVCLETCLVETDAIGPSTLTVTVENSQGETATQQAGEYFTNAGPFNGEWIGETVQSSNCGDDGSEGGTITILQGSETTAAVYDLVPRPNWVSGDINGGVLNSRSGYDTETASGIPIRVTDWQATLVGDDQLEGSATFEGSCSGTYTFTAIRG